MKSRNVATYGMLIALAFILSYIERIITIPVPIPGIKIGLANLVVITALYLMGAKHAFVLSMIRIILVGFTFGNLSTMLFSFAGGILSWVLMVLARKIQGLSMTGVSILGGVGHNAGQIAVAMFVVNSTTLVYYLPVLILSGLVAGTVIGILGALLVNSLRHMH
jgi:heptaprenyl diphosphate synthase